MKTNGKKQREARKRHQARLITPCHGQFRRRPPSTFILFHPAPVRSQDRARNNPRQTQPSRIRTSSLPLRSFGSPNNTGLKLGFSVALPRKELPRWKSWVPSHLPYPLGLPFPCEQFPEFGSHHHESPPRCRKELAASLGRPSGARILRPVPTPL